METGRWLLMATRKLEQAGIGTARLDALVLLEDVSGVDRAWLLAEADTELNASKAAELEKLLTRRSRHEPLAYVRGLSEFYGRDFVISPAVLEPRPESEAIIGQLKALETEGALDSFRGKKLRIADVGSGSGALGVTAALELPNSSVDLLDIDPKTLEIAKINVDKYTISISLLESDLLANAPNDYDVLMCNLPYVPDDYKINLSAMHEPRIAIFGGPDGLDLYQKLFEQLEKLPYAPLYLLCESLPPQHNKLRSIARNYGYEHLRTDDFVQVFKAK